MEFVLNNYRAFIEISILWGGLYLLYRAFHTSRGANIFLGIGGTLLFLTLITEILQLQVVEWILTRIVALLAFGLIVIFQPELRSTFARIGSARWFGINQAKDGDFIEELTHTVEGLAKKRHGALIAIEQSVGLGDYTDTGVGLDALYSSALAECIFHPKTTLHDGGMLIHKERIVAAGCLFPVSQKELSDRSIGLRHRAAIGLTEETDAIALIVSEESGKMSLAKDGKLERDLSKKQLDERLNALLGMAQEPTET